MVVESVQPMVVESVPQMVVESVPQMVVESVPQMVVESVPSLEVMVDRGDEYWLLSQDQYIQLASLNSVEPGYYRVMAIPEKGRDGWSEAASVSRALREISGVIVMGTSTAADGVHGSLSGVVIERVIGQGYAAR